MHGLYIPAWLVLKGIKSKARISELINTLKIFLPTFIELYHLPYTELIEIKIFAIESIKGHSPGKSNLGLQILKCYRDFNIALSVFISVLKCDLQLRDRNYNTQIINNYCSPEQYILLSPSR